MNNEISGHVRRQEEDLFTLNIRRPQDYFKVFNAIFQGEELVFADKDMLLAAQAEDFLAIAKCIKEACKPLLETENPNIIVYREAYNHAGFILKEIYKISCLIDDLEIISNYSEFVWQLASRGNKLGLDLESYSSFAVNRMDYVCKAIRSHIVTEGRLPSVLQIEDALDVLSLSPAVVTVGALRQVQDCFRRYQNLNNQVAAEMCINYLENSIDNLNTGYASLYQQEKWGRTHKRLEGLELSKAGWKLTNTVLSSCASYYAVNSSFDIYNYEKAIGCYDKILAVCSLESFDSIKELNHQLARLYLQKANIAQIRGDSQSVREFASKVVELLDGKSNPGHRTLTTAKEYLHEYPAFGELGDVSYDINGYDPDMENQDGGMM